MYNYDVLRDPPDEEEIISNWKTEKGILVSICMLSYNHEKYICNALNSILNQKTDFGFEILIHDDASRDDSQKIILEYTRRYPRIIKPILQKVNQQSQEIYPSVNFNYPRANSPFMAMCECDDHWIGEHKLQKQIDALLDNPHVDFSFHSAILVDYKDPNKPEARLFGDYAKSDAVIPLANIMHRTRGWIPTASCVIRKRAKDEFLSFLKDRLYLTLGDIYLQFFGARSGGALFFSEPMSLYRYRTPQSWSDKIQSDSYRTRMHNLAMLRSYLELDQITNHVYSYDFSALILQRLIWLYEIESDFSSNQDFKLLSEMYASCNLEINGTISRIVNEYDRYVIFGCGSGAKKLMSLLPRNRVQSIVDRDGLRGGQEFEGKPIIHATDLATQGDYVMLISTIGQDKQEIRKIAAQASLSEDKVVYLYDTAIDLIRKKPIPVDIFFDLPSAAKIVGS